LPSLYLISLLEVAFTPLELAPPIKLIDAISKAGGDINIGE
jgi:hypothetical protein